MTGTAAVKSMAADRWTRSHGIAAGVLGALGVLATWDAWRDIYGIAVNDDEYSHIFLVPLVLLWLVWVRRMRVRHCAPRALWIGPVILAAGWAIASYGFYNAHQSLWHAGSVMVVVGCVLSVLGKAALVRFFPAFLLLIFLVPVPGRLRQEIALPLQEKTATVANTALEAAGFDTIRSGNMLIVNGQPVTIAEACNGVRGVFSLVMVAFAFSFGMPLRNFVRALILLASPLVVLALNVVRILPTAWMFGYRSQEAALKFHDASGWIMLILAFLLLYGLIKVLEWAMIPVNQYTLASQQQGAI